MIVEDQRSRVDRRGNDRLVGERFKCARLKSENEGLRVSGIWTISSQF